MTPVITPDELARLAAPFPLNVHSMREGNKVRGGKGIQWFTYMDKSEVENRLTEVFGGDWGTTQPVIVPLGESVSSTIGITIRGIMRADTGEDSGKGSERAKGATTDAFRRAGAKWGIAKYLYDMDFPIYTDSYPDGDWDAKKAREKEALQKFTEWYNKKFKGAGVTPLNGTQPERTPQQALKGNGPDERTITPAKPQNAANANVGANSGKGYKEHDLWNAVLKTVYANNPIHMKNSLKKLNESGALNPFMSLDEAIAAVTNRKDIA